MNAITKIRPADGIQIIADRLRRMATALESGDVSLDEDFLNIEGLEFSSKCKTSPNAKAMLATKAIDLLGQRQRRTKFFPAKMFGEPAWDILLDLYCHEVAGKRISVSSLCIAGGSPYATGLRWLRYLEESGMVWRDPDLRDLRYEWVKLAPEARNQLEAFLEGFEEETQTAVGKTGTWTGLKAI